MDSMVGLASWMQQLTPFVIHHVLVIARVLTFAQHDKHFYLYNQHNYMQLRPRHHQCDKQTWKWSKPLSGHRRWSVLPYH